MPAGTDPPSLAHVRQSARDGADRLGSWKEIANYLGRTVRTVQRWEKTEHLPVRRLHHDSGASVFAFKHELDRWLTRRSLTVEDGGTKSRTTVDTAPQPVSESGDIDTPASPRRRLAWVAVTGLVVAAVAAWLMLRDVPGPALPDHIVPQVLTTDPGVERFPALSPDGRQVAYTYGDDEGRVDIFLRLIGVDESMQLTRDALTEESPTWSPDGLFVAFLRRTGPGQRELRIVPALGGAERLVARFTVPGYMDDARSFAATTHWSPDGRWLAVTEGPDEPGTGGLGISVYDVESGERRILTQTVPGSDDMAPRFSPDGRQLVFAHSAAQLESELRVLAFDPDTGSAGRIRSLTRATPWNSEPEWSIDGREIVFSSGRWPRTGLWRIAADGSSEPRPLTGAGQGGAQATIAPLSLPDGGTAVRLVYSVIALENDIWQFPLDSSGPASRLLSTSQRERFPAYSADGRVAFLSDRSGHREIWVAQANGDAWAQWTRWESAYIWRPAFSPDGTRLAYTVQQDGRLKSHVQEGPLQPPQPLTLDAAGDDDLAWSRDGNTLYLSSTDRGTAGPAIWSVTAAGGVPEMVIEGAGTPLGEDPDAEHLYLARSIEGSMELLRLLLADGSLERIELMPAGRHSFTLGPDGVYFVAESAGRFSIRRWSWDSGEESVVRELSLEPEIGMAISPDGRRALLARITLRRSDLMLADPGE